jgi:serine/threonine protein kinase
VPWERFGPYRIEAEIGRGGMGEVHRAVDERKERVVALKRLPSDFAGDRELAERFKREAAATSRLQSPHVIPIHDYGEINGQLYIDMRLVEGFDLGALIRRTGRIGPNPAVRILGQVGDALSAAHRDQLVHRDVKPSNILVTSADEVFAYLIDFGIAACMVQTRLTLSGTAIGTAAYMAPECFHDGKRGDHRVDVYALGCVLYEMLTGRPPYPGTSWPQLMYSHLRGAIPLPSLAAPVPKRFDDIVRSAMAKDPDKRFPDVETLVNEAKAIGASRPQRRQSEIPTRIAERQPPIPHPATPVDDKFGNYPAWRRYGPAIIVGFIIVAFIVLPVLGAVLR